VFTGGTHKTVRLVGAKTKGVGFEFRRHRYSATRVIIEISLEARRLAACAASSGSINGQQQKTQFKSGNR
jgi:hypothetical protein